MAYKKGESGNPEGRPKGAVTTATKLRREIEDALPEILATVTTAAKNGDIGACKLLLDKCIPTPKSVALPVTIPIGANLTETGGNVVAATLDGQIPPDIGGRLITALANQAKLVEFEELADRLARIERILEDRK